MGVACCPSAFSVEGAITTSLGATAVAAAAISVGGAITTSSPSLDAVACFAAAFGAGVAITTSADATGISAADAPLEGVTAAVAGVAGSAGAAAAGFSAGVGITTSLRSGVATSDSVAKDIWVLGRLMAEKKAAIPAAVTGVNLMASSVGLFPLCFPSPPTDPGTIGAACEVVGTGSDSTGITGSALLPSTAGAGVSVSSAPSVEGAVGWSNTRDSEAPASSSTAVSSTGGNNRSCESRGCASLVPTWMT